MRENKGHTHKLFQNWTFLETIRPFALNLVIKKTSKLNIRYLVCAAFPTSIVNVFSSLSFPLTQFSSVLRFLQKPVICFALQSWFLYGTALD